MAEGVAWEPGALRVVVAFFSWLAGPLLVPLLVGVAAQLDQPAGLLLGGLAALWWSGCLVVLTRWLAPSGRRPRSRPWRGSLLSRVVGRVLSWLLVGGIWLVTTTAVTLTVARLRIPTRNGGTPLDFGDGSPLVAVGQALGWVAFGLALVGPVAAWLATPRGEPLSDQQPPAAP